MYKENWLRIDGTMMGFEGDNCMIRYVVVVTRRVTKIRIKWCLNSVGGSVSASVVVTLFV